MSAYLTEAEATARLLDLGITASPSDALLRLASARLDAQGPFYGARYDFPQDLAFPRTYTAYGDTDGEVPEAVKDWTAVEASKMLTSVTTGEKAPVSSISFSDVGSVTYARPKVDGPSSLQRGLLSPYQIKHATLG